MKFITLFLFISLSILSAQGNLKLVRLSEVREAWLAGDHEKTLEIILSQEADGNLDAKSMYNIGYLYLLKDDYNNALLYLQTAIVKEPSFPYSYLQISRIYKKIGNLYAAQDHLERGLNQDSDNIDLLMEMAGVCLALNETDKAEEYYRDILEEDENNVTAIAGLASIHHQKGNLDAATKVLQENVNVYPEASILLEKAKIAEASGAYEESKRLLTQIVTDYPHSKNWQHIRDTLHTRYNVSEVPIDTTKPGYRYTIDPNEELDYKVTYGPMTLGWLKVRVQKLEEINGKKIYPIVFYVDTNPSYSFILSLHHIYESYIDPVSMNAYKSRLYTPGDENSLAKTYYYDYDENIFTAYIVHTDGHFSLLKKDLPQKVQDGTSMLYFARGLVSNKLSGTTTVVIDEEFKYGTVKFLNETESFESSGNIVDALKIFARAEFKGVAGMNGDAWGWFSSDMQSTPLKGSIEIIVGSITVEVDGEKTEIPNFHEDANEP
jgi:Tfp pilus assembly protein PilF